MYDVRIYRNMGDSNAFGRNRVAVAGSGVQRAHVQCAREEKCIRNVLSLDKGVYCVSGNLSANHRIRGLRLNWLPNMSNNTYSGVQFNYI